MPNLLRSVAKGRCVYSVLVIMFIDDVSGNVSQQWNKHYCCYASNGALPRCLQELEENIQFVATSSHAKSLEMIKAICSSFRETFDDPIPTWDAELGEECLIHIFPLFFPGDNPMQAELCLHAGLAANHFCRMCKVGGTQEFKRSEQGYPTLFKSGVLRDLQTMQQDVADQIMWGLDPGATSTLEGMVRDSGVKDSLAHPTIEGMIRLGIDLRRRVPGITAKSPEEVWELLNAELNKKGGADGMINPLLDIDGIDIHLDTPTEILHAILLGVIKYFWAQTMLHIIQSKKSDIFLARLNSVSKDGLDIPPITADYMFNYRGSLIGKHFKAIVQIMPFIVYDLVSKDTLDAWLAISWLVVLLWHTEIKDMDIYCVRSLSPVLQCDPLINLVFRLSYRKSSTIFSI
ncbi:hypothetical protein BOTBODRAFT_109086 [Botryobasidium botryosum FD-172 SS1]|uniref:Uncharacterized protein n=1 Tax=Botryobasidium botryosum (strain FD-172 SS1) TaxID=930990 RepID=A0A067MJX0_BOTB1|nr:hypothetical protein BOTBODRAFT_109086 [Botryobasidium botryosum FD-172 SS1]